MHEQTLTLNLKAMNILLSTINIFEFNHVSNCEMTKEIYD